MVAKAGNWKRTIVIVVLRYSLNTHSLVLIFPSNRIYLKKMSFLFSMNKKKLKEVMKKN